MILDYRYLRNYKYLFRVFFFIDILRDFKLFSYEYVKRKKSKVQLVVYILWFSFKYKLLIKVYVINRIK